MKVIQKENNKAMLRTAIFLVVFGSLLAAFGYMGRNYATAFFGISFSVLSLICFFYIKKKKDRIAKIAWGMGTPALIFASVCIFTLNSPIAISSYSYLFIGGMLFCAYSFQAKEDKIPMWLSIGLFFLGLLFYDRIIIYKNFEGTELINVFDADYLHFKITQVLHFISLVYLLILIQSNKVSIETKLSTQIQKLHNFTSNLITSSKNKLISSGNLKEALEEIVRNTSHVLDVSRVSVWEMDPTDYSIHLIVGYDLVQGDFFYSGHLRTGSYPLYFQSLISEKIVMADDALHDPKTKEYAKSYLIPLGIKSMMDSPFFIDGQFRGILCCEEQRSMREWDEMDQLFSLSISKLISISYYCQIRLKQYNSLVETSEELEKRNAVLEKVYTQIMKINGDLAANLLSKEEEAKELQGFINEVSFKNAHHVRGPLSRILGLINLYKTETDEETKKVYIGFINKSALELDEMVREISNLLGKPFQK